MNSVFSCDVSRSFRDVSPGSHKASALSHTSGAHTERKRNCGAPVSVALQNSSDLEVNFDFGYV